MNWKQTVNDISSRRYVIPDGWDTKEKVAKELECSPNKVPSILKPGIESGEIERQEFHVWDAKKKCVIRVACFRVTARRKRDPKTVKPNVTFAERGLEEKVLASLKANPKRTDRQIAKCHRGATTAMVAALRGKVRKG